MLGDTLWLSSFFLFFSQLRTFSCILSLLLRQRRSVDVAASLKLTVAASAERSRASFEIGHAALGLSFLHQEPRVGGTLGGALRDGSDGWRSPVPRGENTVCEFFLLLPSNIPCRSRRQVAYIVMPSGVGQCTRWQVLYVRTGSLSCLQFTTLRRLCGQLLRQQQKGQHPEGGCWFAVSGEQKKQRVVSIVTDGWLATAGLRGG